MTQQVYATRLLGAADTIDATQWDELLAQQARPTLFMRHAFLGAVEGTGCASARTGWTPQWLVLEDQQGLAAAAPLYLKAHSYGEYVFDWAWADAYRRHGLAYYPKLLCAVPFTPVPGTRLLARDTHARIAMARAIMDMARQRKLSSAHVLLMDDEDAQALQAAGWMLRSGVQFHWQQSADAPVPSFEALLAGMQRHKRKNILQERRRVAEAGVSFCHFEGRQIDADLWDFFYACYQQTYAEHGSMPYLSRSFFAALADLQPENWLMFVANRGGERVAASLVAIDRKAQVAYGRHWGCLQHIPHLHFEACYYQPLQWCLENGFIRFEGGAQGEHKIARGLLPVATRSAHWIADPRFARAVDDFLAQEGEGVAQYLDELRERTPFKKGVEQPPS